MPRAAVPVERRNIRQSSRSVGIGDPGGYLPLTIIDSRYSTMSWKISFSGVRIFVFQSVQTICYNFSTLALRCQEGRVNKYRYFL